MVGQFSLYTDTDRLQPFQMRQQRILPHRQPHRRQRRVVLLRNPTGRPAQLNAITRTVSASFLCHNCFTSTLCIYTNNTYIFPSRQAFPVVFQKFGKMLKHTNRPPETQQMPFRRTAERAGSGNAASPFDAYSLPEPDWQERQNASICVRSARTLPCRNVSSRPPPRPFSASFSALPKGRRFPSCAARAY